MTQLEEGENNRSGRGESGRIEVRWRQGDVHRKIERQGQSDGLDVE